MPSAMPGADIDIFDNWLLGREVRHSFGDDGQYPRLVAATYRDGARLCAVLQPAGPRLLETGSVPIRRDLWMRAATAEPLRFASRFCYFDERPSDHTAHHGAASLEPFTMPVAGVPDTSGQGCWHETNAGIRLYRGSAPGLRDRDGLDSQQPHSDFTPADMVRRPRSRLARSVSTTLARGPCSSGCSACTSRVDNPLSHIRYRRCDEG